MSWDPLPQVPHDWSPDQFTDRLERVFELAIDHPEADVEELAGWTVRPIHEIDPRPGRDEGLEVRTPRGVFLVVVQQVTDRG